jgi:phosphatidylethanolamine/phosphatidyl-N-methylethanolamine N-methyltransferase
MLLGETFAFLKAFVRHPGQVGAVAPSSRFLARAMVAGLELADGEAVIELGPGTGPFTAEIARLTGRPGTYLGIEREGAFVEMLRDRFPHMPIAHGSAEHAHELARQAGLGPVRAVISGLPFAVLEAGVQDRIMAALDQLLGPGGEFRTFQYLHAWPMPQAVRFRRRMAGLFGPHRASRVVLLNLPPAMVLTWRRQAEAVPAAAAPATTH